MTCDYDKHQWRTSMQRESSRTINTTECLVCGAWGGTSVTYPIDLMPNYMAICKHRSLAFWSGGFYIGCMDCSVKWVAIRGPKDTDLDYSRGSEQLSGDVRSQPERI